MKRRNTRAMSITRTPTRARLPRFLKIAESIRSDIVVGRLPEHAPLPSERALAETYAVSRMTARRALETLEALGLAYAADRRGRFVSPRRVRYDLSNRISFAADAHAAGTNLQIKLVRMRATHADAVLAEILDVPSGEEIFEYTRLFLIEGHPALIETEIVIAQRCPGLLSHDLRQSTTQLLSQVYGLSARTGDITIRMRPILPDEARLLEVAQYQAGLELEQIIKDDGGRPFCFGRQIWRGELAEFLASAVVSS